MGLFATTLLPLSLCFLICAQLSATASQSSNFAGRHKRSDSVNTLDAASGQTTANLTPLKAKISAMQADLTALKAKHCEPGQIRFSPHAQTEVVNGKHRTRCHKLHVNFSHPFNTVPWVAISLAGMVVESHRNIRVNIDTSAVSTSGFDATACEWFDSTTYNATATWVACNV